MKKMKRVLFEGSYIAAVNFQDSCQLNATILKRKDFSEVFQVVISETPITKPDFPSLDGVS